MTNQETPFLHNLQFVFLFDGFTLPQNEYATLAEKFKTIFDGIQQILPIPPSVNFDFPIIILQSKDLEWKLEISKKRVNLFHTPIKKSSKMYIPIKFVNNDFKKKLNDILDIFRDFDNYFYFSKVGLILHGLIKYENTTTKINSFLSSEKQLFIDNTIETTQIIRKTKKNLKFNKNQNVEFLQHYNLLSGLKKENDEFLQFTMDINNFESGIEIKDKNDIENFLDLFYEEYNTKLNNI